MQERLRQQAAEMRLPGVEAVEKFVDLQQRRAQAQRCAGGQPPGTAVQHQRIVLKSKLLQPVGIGG